MPHALTKRQREYLDFIKSFIRDNESSPRLGQIAKHFKVKPPSVHKMLEVLQRKGYLYFGRDSTSGFFIRLVERAGSAEAVTEIVIAGKLNQYGEVVEFPKKHGHFASLIKGSKPEELFGIVAIEEIPNCGILIGDLIIFDYGMKPKQNEVALIAIGERWLLIRVVSKTFDKLIRSDVMASDYPIPEDLRNVEREQLLNWHPFAFDESTEKYFLKLAEVEEIRMGPIPSVVVAATAIRLSRQLAF